MADPGASAPASGNEGLRTIGLSLALTLVVGLICTRAEIDSYLTEAFTATAGAVPAGLGVLAHRRKVKAALAAGQAAPRQVAPALAMILTAAVLLIVDSILGAIGGAMASTMTDPDEIASLSDTLSYISIAVMAILLGYATRWFGSGPYRWAAITVGFVLLFRIILVTLVDMLVPEDVLSLVLDDVIVGHLKVLGAAMVTTYIAVRMRSSATKPATVGPAPVGVRGPTYPPSAYPGAPNPPFPPTAYPPAPPTVPMARAGAAHGPGPGAERSAGRLVRRPRTARHRAVLGRYSVDGAQAQRLTAQRGAGRAVGGAVVAATVHRSRRSVTRGPRGLHSPGESAKQNLGTRPW